MSGVSIEESRASGARLRYAVSSDRRSHGRRALELPLSFRSTFSLPRGESGKGVATELADGGMRLRTDGPLDIGQWLRLDWSPSLHVRNAMPERLRPLNGVKARVVRAIAVDPDSGELPYAYGVVLAMGRPQTALAYFDLALPWIGVLLILATALDVVWLRGNNLYYFWYHPLINLYSVLISAYILSRIALACVYKSPRDAGLRLPISVAISCKNEEGAIRETLECIYRSDYPPELMQVIAVDDGSTDGTWAEMESVQASHPDLELVRFEKNRGKRHGMAAAARRATGDIVIYVDSDSFVRRDAFARIVQGFADPEVGAVCGHGTVANPEENFLTKMQEVRYYVAFRIVKSAESLFDTVTCCSGCLAAYRRSYMMDFLDVWLEQRFLGRAATFGDDRSLTNFMLRRWRVVYDANAICATIVPATLSVFFRQQLRWKKSWIRESVLASMFMWKRHPLAAFYFYLGVIFPFVSPAVVFGALVLPLLGVGSLSVLYIYGTFLMALLYGLVYLVRYKRGLWIYGLAFSFFYMVVLVWQTYYALVTVRRNHWGTR
jgi:hyaluronan synthase